MQMHTGATRPFHPPTLTSIQAESFRIFAEKKDGGQKIPWLGLESNERCLPWIVYDETGHEMQMHTTKPSLFPHFLNKSPAESEDFLGSKKDSVMAWT
jgi:hypothetical protein